jgi:four helix bundle protein
VKIKSYAELVMWQKTNELTLEVFRITERFARRDMFGIVSQIRRFSSSVGANIAEGFGRGTTPEFLRSLQISRGEIEETRYFLHLSRDLGRITPEEFERLGKICDSTGRLLNALGTSLRKRMDLGNQTPVTNHQSRSSTLRH